MRKIFCFAVGVVAFISACAHPMERAGTKAAGGAGDVRADFLKLIGRARVDLAAEETGMEAGEAGLVERHFSFMANAGDRVPGVLVKQAEGRGRRPVVIFLHGTGGTKTGMLPLMRRVAGKGFICVAIDGRYHGERTKAGKGTVEYEEAIVRAFHEGKEHPFFFDTAWDVMRLIDYLETRVDVYGGRIGLYGVSKGGIETYLAAAADPRIACAVPCIGVQSFAWALEHDGWHSRIGTIPHAFAQIAKDEGVAEPDAALVKKLYDRVAPGIDGEFDGPSMVVLIAPRPLLIINGDSDARTPLPGLALCTDEALDRYHELGADERLQIRIQANTGHKVNPDSEEAAVEWFVKWLRP